MAKPAKLKVSMMSYEKTEAEHKEATEKAVREIKGKLWAFYLEVDHAYNWRMQYDCEDVVTIRTLRGHLAEALEGLGEDLEGDEDPLHSAVYYHKL